MNMILKKNLNGTGSKVEPGLKRGQPVHYVQPGL